MIVLNQIKKDIFHFKTYAAARIQEICENTLNYPIIWSHICSQENLSDLLTRKYLKDPCELPWAQPAMKISVQTFEVFKIPMSSLPDADKKQILLNSAITYDTTPDLVSLMFYNKMKMQQCTENKNVKAQNRNPA